MSRDHAAARSRFPRGLRQPASGFRFGTDSLLLAAFAARGGGRKVLDLGSGCGVAGFGYQLMKDHDVHLAGLDRDPAMVEAAQANAEALGLAPLSRFHLADVRDPSPFPSSCHMGTTDLVLCNPPYRQPGTGRLPAPERQDARFALHGNIDDFVHTGSRALRTGGRFCLVHLAEQLPDIMTCFLRHGCQPKRLQCVHPREGERAKLVLLEARKAGGAGLRVEPPLILHEGEGLSAQAMAYCPFLACNPGPLRGPCTPEEDAT